MFLLEINHQTYKSWFTAFFSNCLFLYYPPPRPSGSCSIDLTFPALEPFQTNAQSSPESIFTSKITVITNRKS